MRIFFSLVLLALIAALLLCLRNTRHSNKAIVGAVRLMVASVIPPMIGNMIIISSSWKYVSVVGYYFYFLGMDLIMFALLRFSYAYCRIPKKYDKLRLLADIPLAADVIQYAFNPFTKHAFWVQAIWVDGARYYKLLPYWGQSFHRILDYAILAVGLVIFLVKIIQSPRINSERYSVIFGAMVVTSIWESVYIVSRTPVDRAMIGFGVFGLLVYYLSLYYRPMRLLDSMLAHMVSEMPEALFFFDGNGQCIWANNEGIKLVGLDGEDFEPYRARILELFGDYRRKEKWQEELTQDGQTRSYALEKHNVTDDRQRIIGAFLSVRDNTREQKTLQQEMYRATHDSLTSVFNRAGYDLLVSTMDLKSTSLLLVDADDFKSVNDTFGHETGDRVLQKIARALKNSFRAEDGVCRIGGDEFVVFLPHTNDQQNEMIVSRIQRINEELADTGDGLPPISISAGIAHGESASEAAQLFEHADHALYDTKNKGKRGYTIFQEV